MSDVSPDGSSPTAVDLRDYVDFDVGGASDRRVFSTDVVAVDIVCLEPWQEVQARTFHEADAIYTVLGGIAWLVTDEAQVTLSALQSVMVPATVPHGIRNNYPDPLVLQVVVSPPEEAPKAVVGPREPDGETSSEPGRSWRDRLLRMRRALGG